MTVSARIAIGIVALAAPFVAAGCTADKTGTQVTSSSPATSAAGAATTPLTTPAPRPAASGPGISAGGVTTSVNAQPSSLEEEYYQACRAAADWIAGKPGNRDELVEQYLKHVQTPPHADAGTFHSEWGQLAPERQAAVIVAANAAADSQC